MLSRGGGLGGERCCQGEGAKGERGVVRGGGLAGERCCQGEGV